jgi:hypothetical protein
MVRRSLAPALILMVAAASGCKTTQPTLAPAQDAQIEFLSVATTVSLYEVWDTQLVTVTSASDGTSVQTVQDLGLWCDVSASSAQQTRQDAKYPFRFAVEIERIPAGTANVERLTADSYRSNYASLTAYDDSSPETPSKHAVDWNQELSVPGANPAVYLSLKNGRRISTASRDFIETLKIASGTATSYGSVCPIGGTSSARNLGDPAVAGSPSTFGVQVNAGDVITVKARSDPNPGASALFIGTTTPSFGSRASLAGKNVTLVGRSSSAQPSEGISYSFTAR